MFTKFYEKVKSFIKDNYKGLIVILMVYLLFAIELPYQIYTPGGAVDLNSRIKVEDGNKVDGSFNMAYVSMVKGSVPFLLISKIIPDWDIIKAEDVTNEGENLDELLVREKLYLEESIDAATINAYKKAGRDINITKINNLVSYIASDAKTNLKQGDNIISIDNKEISSLKELKDMVSKKDEDEKVNIKVLRGKKEIDTYAYTYNTIDGIKIGVSIVNTYEYAENPKVTIKSKSSEAGSSGGLMMSLTIYNQLVKEDITKGKKIVGTGTIDIDGNVGVIGGVKYKLIGAVKNKADVFICPEDNYKEAIKVAKEKKYKIKIISAKTFDDVLEKLENM